MTMPPRSPFPFIKVDDLGMPAMVAQRCTQCGAQLRYEPGQTVCAGILKLKRGTP